LCTAMRKRGTVKGKAGIRTVLGRTMELIVEVPKKERRPFSQWFVQNRGMPEKRERKGLTQHFRVCEGGEMIALWLLPKELWRVHEKVEQDTVGEEE